MRTILGVILAAAVALPASATVIVAPAPTVANPTILVEGGCGRDYHRDGRGFCRPNWREWEQGWRACPPGWHLGSEGRRCWPN